MGLDEVLDSDVEQSQVNNVGTSLDETFNEKFNIDVEADEDPSMDPNKGKQIHRFYFPKYHIIKDPELELRIKEAEKLVEEKNEARLTIESSISSKVDDLTEIIFKLRPLMREDKEYSDFLKENWRQRDASLQKLGKLHLQRTTKNGSKNVGVYLCSSEEELNDLILSLRYRLKCESDGFDDEKLLLREIKLLEGTRSKVKAIAARREKILALEGQNGSLQYELMEEQQCNVKERKHKLARKIKLMKEQHKAIERGIKSLKKELAFAERKRGEMYEALAELRRQSDEPNACHYKNCLLLRDARALAAKKDIASLEELSNKEVEKFMSLWNNDKTFRDDYLSRSLPSLIDRNLDSDEKADNPVTNY